MVQAIGGNVNKNTTRYQGSPGKGGQGSPPPVKKGLIGQAREIIGGLGPIESMDNLTTNLSLFKDFKDTQGLLGLQRRLITKDLKNQVQAIQDQRHVDLGAVASSAADRGLLGSSSQFTGQENVKNAAASQILSARSQAGQGKLANLAQLMQARRDYKTGLLNAFYMKQAMRSSGATEDFLNGLIGTTGTSGKGTGGGTGGDDKGKGTGTTSEDLTWMDKLKQAKGNPTRLEQLTNIFEKRFRNKKGKYTNPILDETLGKYGKWGVENRPGEFNPIAPLNHWWKLYQKAVGMGPSR